MKLDDWNDRTHRKTKTKTIPCIRRLDSLTHHIEIEENIVLTYGLYWVILEPNRELIFGPWHSIEDAVERRELTRWEEEDYERN
jgi:hypothetical protein